MLTFVPYLLTLGLLAGWGVIFILTSHIRELESVLIVHSTHTSFSAHVARKIEDFFMRLYADLRTGLIEFTISVLGAFLPWFRKVSRIFEARLEQTLNAVRGRGKFNPNSRSDSSPFIKDMRDHVDGIGDGRIE